MSAARKYFSDTVLSTEWCGITPNGEIPPKSFEWFEHDSDAMAKAYRGLFYLIGDYKSSSNFKLLNTSTNLSNTTGNFQEIILLNAISKIEDSLALSFRARYERFVENSPKILGRIDFIKTLNKNLGIQGKHTISYNRFTFDHPLHELIKYSSLMLARDLGSLLDEKPKQQLTKSINRIQDLLDECRLVDNHVRTAIRLLYNHDFDYEQEFQSILSEVKILAYLYLQKKIGPSAANESVPIDCFRLNLNRPFEKLIRNSLEQIGMSKFDSGINKIYLGCNIKEVPFDMRPDCYGELDGRIVIVDAKHKVYQANRAKDDDDEVSSTHINRNDFYQIISYARTHNNQSSKDLYGLVGLTMENSYSDEILGPPMPDINVKYDVDGVSKSATLCIKRISLNFGSILRRIGIASANGDAAMSKIYKEIGSAVYAELKRIAK